MDFDALLNGRDCACGRRHTCDIRKVIVEEGALARLGELVSGKEHILLAADENTFGTCGEKVREILGGLMENTLIYHRDGLLVPNEEAVAEMEALLTEKTDLIVGIGSGVIQDLCKFVSFRASLPYGIVATAPSMDGYASTGAAMIMNNGKVTYSAHVPDFILGDVDVLKNAPMDMIRSGYGDIVGKYSCLNDWKLSRIVNGEYFCDYVYGLTFDMLKKTEGLYGALQKREPDAIRTLTEALIGIGIAMAYVGNSRPGSGSEHHLSHFFEVVGIMNGEPYFLHGIDVLFSSVVTERLRETLLSIEKPEKGADFDRDVWEKRIRQIYTDAADGIIELQDKVGRYERDDFSVYAEKWEQIREVLREAPSSEQMLRFVSAIGLDFADFEERYGEEKIRTAIAYAKDLKDRYTVLWLYYTLFSKE